MIVLCQAGSLKELTFQRYAMELIKGDVPSNIGAWLVKAFLLDLQDIGFICSNFKLKNIISDKSKIVKKKARLKVTTHQ